MIFCAEQSFPEAATGFGIKAPQKTLSQFSPGANKCRLRACMRLRSFVL